ncbi:Zinc finger protein dzip1l [Boothiomyces macroporosus]|uniref:Zinc finger protein dzip1l n=1 Tax=Boothiomyces macroporosus TaxID=261099 RepID=A0AAD5Y5Q8_9FUNG|nr:Zinc finger protein dzip1l [Boothiomyces macroporosus]
MAVDNERKRTRKKEKQDTAEKEFYFKPKRQRINWRVLTSLNVDDIVRKNDVGSLQNIIENITFCDAHESGRSSITSDLESVDPNMLKLFQLAQLIIEFLLYTQTDLIEKNNAINEANQNLKLNMDELNAKLTSQGVQLESGKKEIKTLKKTVYAYELMTKMPGTQANQAPDVIYHRCRFCPKAFSSRSYLQSHEERRHSDLLSEEIALNPRSTKDESTKKELERMAELLEKITASKPEPPKQVVNDELLKQEKLKFEMEIQDIKSAMYKEIEQEKELLRKDREAFEKLIENQGKQLAHVGSLESEDEDENKSVVSQITNEIKKITAISKNVEREIKGLKENEFELKQLELEKLERDRLMKEKEREEAVKRDIENLKRELMEKDAKQQALLAQKDQEQLVSKLQLQMKAELEQLKSNLQLENEKKTSLLESKLLAAANQIEELKKSKLTERVNLDNNLKLNSEERKSDANVENTKVESELKDGIPAFETQAKKKLDTNLEWKDYLTALKGHTFTPNPNAKWATSYFDHTVHSMMAQKDIIAHEVEQVLALRGITQASMKNFHSDPSVKILFEQMKNDVDERHKDLLQYNCFSEMYNFMKTNLEKACTEAVGNPLAIPNSNLSSPLKTSMTSIAQNRSPIPSASANYQGYGYSPSAAFLTPTYNRNISGYNNSSVPIYNNQSVSSPNLNSSPRRSSLRPSSAPSGGRASPTKNVKILDSQERNSGSQLKNTVVSSTTIVTENVNKPWYSQQLSASPSNEATSPWSWDNYDRSIHSQQNPSFHFASAHKGSKSNLPTPTAMDLALAIAPKEVINPALLKEVINPALLKEVIDPALLKEVPSRPPPSPPRDRPLNRSLSVKSAKETVTAAKEGFKEMLGKMTRSLSRKGKKPSGRDKFNSAMEKEIKRASNENLAQSVQGTVLSPNQDLARTKTLSNSKDRIPQEVETPMQKAQQNEPPKSAKGILKIQIPHANSVVTTPSEATSSAISESSEYTSESEQLSKSARNTGNKLLIVDISRSRTLSSVPETSEDESSEPKLVKIKSLSNTSLNSKKPAVQPIPQISVHKAATPVEGAFIVPLVDKSQSHGESSKNTPLKRSVEDVNQSPKKSEMDATSDFSFSISEVSAPTDKQKSKKTEEEEDQELMEFLEEIDATSDAGYKKPATAIPDIDDIDDFDD